MRTLPGPTRLLALFGLVGLLASAAALAAQQTSPDITPNAGRLVVTGTAEVTTKPDRASFTVEITNDGVDADAVLDANARRAETVIEALRDSGVEISRLETRGVRLDPQWSPRPRSARPDWRPEIIGYRASNRIELTTPELDRVGALLATAVEAGANGIDGVRFLLEDETAARDEAIRRATTDALRKADVMAGAAGVAVGSILELRLDQATTTLPPLAPQARMEFASMDAVRAVPVEPGDIRLDASVTVTLALAR